MVLGIPSYGDEEEEEEEEEAQEQEENYFKGVHDRPQVFRAS